MAVLLIGFTGMGKSTFGNYLIDPDGTHMLDNPTFSPAWDNKPMTQEVKIVTKKVQIDDDRNEMLTIIDTPGLDESAAKKLYRAIDIVKKLNECREIRVCILVVKFNAKIDAQYKATLEYYSKLLPGLFDNNVIIVMTDYATDERSEIMRKRQHINVEQVKCNTIEELRKCSNNPVTYSPQLFTIDCLPLEQAEMEISLAVRTAILDYIFQLPPIKVKNQMVAKTDYIKHKDSEKYQKLQGEIEGYSERLKEARKNSKKVLNDIHKKQEEITEIENKITKERCEAELEAYQKFHKEKLAEIELLEKYIDERCRAAEKYHSDLTVMTIEEAMERLPE
uniref:AIG1-type G domain-containing protein n=1 Tax=Amphimedon queenslandica TaxID=400682 RepID=A0A1X7UK14_AMPQE